MSKQNSYKPLSDGQKKSLIANGCTASDWKSVIVADGFDAASVRNTEFLGKVEIGATTGNIEAIDGIEKPCGIYNATIIDSTIGDNCRIANIGVHIANYNIAENCCIENVGTMSTSPGSTFGNGVEVAALNEAGGREVTIFNELTVQFAYMICVHRYNPKMIEKLQAIANSYVESIRSDRGTVAAGAKVYSTREIINVNIGAAATVNSAATLINGTILSTPEAPTKIGAEVIADDFIIAEASSVTDAVVLGKTFIGQGCQFGKHFSSENSVFFANCEAFHGEACSIFAGPYTVTHHKATLLIAGLFSFFNAGGGTMQSNHMYKLGPCHEGKLERGCKTGASSYTIWPCKLGPFSIILGKHNRTFDTSDLPFTHLDAASGGKCMMIPGMHLITVGTVRDGIKWPKRDRRKGEKRDNITFDIFSPYTIGKMIRGSEILKEFQDNTDRSVDEVTINGANMKRVLLRKCRKFYGTGIDMYLQKKVLARFESALDCDMAAIKKSFAPDTGAVYSEKWCDIGGQLMPLKRLEDFTAQIEAGKIKDIAAFRAALDDIHAAIEKDKWIWVTKAYKQVYGQEVESLTKEDLLKMVDSYDQIRTKFLKLVAVDADKEFNELTRTGFGADGSAEQALEDFKQVRGEYADNSFVLSMAEKIKSNQQRMEMYRKKLSAIS